MKNIFDLENLDDLDSLVKIELLKKTFLKEELFSLFSIKNKLSLDEIIVGFYRKYNKKIKRGHILNIIHLLCKERILTSSKKRPAKYSLVKKNDK